MKYNPPPDPRTPDAKYVTGQPGKVRAAPCLPRPWNIPSARSWRSSKKAGLTPQR